MELFKPPSEITSGVGLILLFEDALRSSATSRRVDHWLTGEEDDIFEKNFRLKRAHGAVR